MPHFCSISPVHQNANRAPISMRNKECPPPPPPPLLHRARSAECVATIMQMTREMHAHTARRCIAYKWLGWGSRRCISLLLWLAGWLPRARSRPAATPSIQACTCSHIANLPLRSTFHLLSAHILLAFSAHCFTSVATDLLIKVGNVSRLCFPARPQLAVPISSIEMCEVDLRREDFPCFYQCTQPKR
jgi:hypothetical protein